MTTRVTAPMTARPAARLTAAVTVGACRGCGACLLTCPEHAIRPAARPDARLADPPLQVLGERCTGCGECIEICPADALSLTGGGPP